MTKPKRHLDLRGKAEIAADAKAANQREANIAKQYIDAGPSISNLARAAYHWYNSVPMLGGQNESGLIIQGGEAPVPSRPTNAIEALEKANQIIKSTRAMRIDKAKENVDFANNYLKRLFSAKKPASVKHKNTTIYSQEEAQQLGVNTGENIITGRGGNRWQSSNNYGGVKRTKERDGGSIHIAPSKRGTFTAAATNHGMGVQEFAARVLRNKEDYSPSLIKKANFARNASKWH